MDCHTRKPVAGKKYKGVHYHPGRKKPWGARISLANGRQKRLGYFKSVEEAARAYDMAAVAMLPPDSYKNFPTLDGQSQPI